MTTLPIAEVRANLSKLVDEAIQTHQRVEVTKNGRRAAVLLSAEDYDSLLETLETLEILGDAGTLGAIREGTSDARAGDLHDLDGVAEEMRTLGRLRR